MIVSSVHEDKLMQLCWAILKKKVWGFNLDKSLILLVVEPTTTRMRMRMRIEEHHIFTFNFRRRHKLLRVVVLAPKNMYIAAIIVTLWLSQSDSS